jgi:hypothetical protein
MHENIPKWLQEVDSNVNASRHQPAWGRRPGTVAEGTTHRPFEMYCGGAPSHQVCHDRCSGPSEIVRFRQRMQIK